MIFLVAKLSQLSSSYTLHKCVSADRECVCELASFKLRFHYHSGGNLVGKGDEVDRLYLSQISIEAVRGWGHSITAAVNGITITVHWQ